MSFLTIDHVQGARVALQKTNVRLSRLHIMRRTTIFETISKAAVSTIGTQRNYPIEFAIIDAMQDDSEFDIQIVWTIQKPTRERTMRMSA